MFDSETPTFHLRDLGLDSATQSALEPGISWIAGAIPHVGYGQFLKGVRDGMLTVVPAPTECTLIPVFDHGNTTSDGLLWDRAIPNLAPTVLAVADGTSGRFGFKNVMTELNAHLAEHFERVRGVVMTTSTWDSRRFRDDYLRTVLAYMNRGVAFVFLLVGPDQRTLIPVLFRP